MAYTFSQRSINNLNGLHRDLVSVAHRAIVLTDVDFAVTEGLRSIARQQELVRTKASKTMRSRHLTGHALDVMAWVNGDRWDWPLYFRIADAFREASIELGIPVEWGGAWGRALGDYTSSEAAYDDYADERREQGKRPWHDGPHFQLPWKEYP